MQGCFNTFLFNLIFLVINCSAVYGKLFDSYPRGEKGIAIYFGKWDIDYV